MEEDDPDFAEDETLMEYRNKRIAEMQSYASKTKFGKVFEINKPSWEEHVTRAPKDISCLILLTQSWSTESQCLEMIWNAMAMKYPTSKFMKATATQVIENYQDGDVPGILFYKDGELTSKLIPAGGIMGGKHMTPTTVEFVLAL
jgi:hypothetical protein